MNSDLEKIMRVLLWENGGGTPLAGVSFSELTDGTLQSTLRQFAARLSGSDDDHSGENEADEDLAFLLHGADLIAAELEDLTRIDENFRKAIHSAARELNAPPVPWNAGTRHALWSLFFPEGARLESDIPGEINRLRNHRTVTVSHLAPDPITKPVQELIFTSNVLMTIPANEDELASVEPEQLRERVRLTMKETQLYYYDHPIHIGVKPDNNEAIYGLRGLNEAVAFEKERGKVESDARLTVLLSLSVTHEGLHRTAREYLHREISRAGEFQNLNVYLFTELECRLIVEKVLQPFLSADAVTRVLDVFGVDGEYGRHYSFLKAVAAFWKVFVDPKVKGTFKIDLDQVFPQNELVAETGESAFDHFTTPLWGATARDDEGTEVELGMIAGALVNEKDIRKGLFTPDVPFADAIAPGEPSVFYNRLPMALSTQAEMMTRYGSGGPDGRTTALHRYHVTGGTNGILLDHLREHRPFTPGFIGRAEDQAFILSVLYKGDGPYLRYLHKPGLIMRHDKEAFAGESIRAAAAGRFVGDLVRTFYYTTYAGILRWGFERTKEQIDPFTGCFATNRHKTVIFLRLAIYLATLATDAHSDEDPRTVLAIARRKLQPLLTPKEGWLNELFLREELAWNQFYDALEAAEVPENAGLRQRAVSDAKEIVGGCEIA